METNLSPTASDLSIPSMWFLRLRETLGCVFYLCRRACILLNTHVFMNFDAKRRRFVLRACKAVTAPVFSALFFSRGVRRSAGGQPAAVLLQELLSAVQQPCARLRQAQQERWLETFQIFMTYSKEILSDFESSTPLFVCFYLLNVLLKIILLWTFFIPASNEQIVLPAERCENRTLMLLSHLQMHWHTYLISPLKG